VLCPHPDGRNVFYQLANGLPLRLCELVHAEINQIPSQPSPKTSTKRPKKRPLSGPASLARRTAKP
jgi:hypothetical protein